jgi:hypothetical protein
LNLKVTAKVAVACVVGSNKLLIPTTQTTATLMLEASRQIDGCIDET